jgi:hypothetical protein
MPCPDSDQEVRKPAIESDRRRGGDRAIGRMARRVTGATDGIATLAKSAESKSVRLAALRAILSDMMAVFPFAYRAKMRSARTKRKTICYERSIFLLRLVRVASSRRHLRYFVAQAAGRPVPQRQAVSYLFRMVTR